MPTIATTLSTGDAVVDYSRAGTGPALMLVHGTAASADVWAPFTALVQDRYTVLAPNLSGSGGTTDADGPLTVDDLADGVIAVIEDAAVGAVQLIGQSLGAVVSATVAARRPDLVKSLVLVSGWTRTDERLRFLFDVWTRALTGDPDLFVRLLVLTGPRREFYDLLGAENLETLINDLKSTIPQGTSRQIAINASVDITSSLSKITARTLVIGCTQDQMIPVEHQREQSAVISAAKYVEVDTGHTFPFEAPELFATTVLGFVDDSDDVHARIHP